MAEGRIKHSDIIEQRDPFKLYIAGVKAADKVTDDFMKKLKGNKTTISNSFANSGPAIKKVNNEITQATVNTKALIAQAKQEANLRAKLSALAKTQADRVAELNVQNQQQRQINQNLAKVNLAAAGSYARIEAEMKTNIARMKQMRVSNKEEEAARKRLASTINKQNDQLKKIDKTMGNSQRNVGNYTGALMNMGRQLMMVAGVGGGLFMFVRVLKSAFKTITGFSKALSSLSAITGATGKELDFLKNKAIELSRESLQSAQDVLKAFELIGSIRPELLQDSKALAEITKNVIILSESTGGVLSLEDAAKALTGTLNQFNLKSEDAAKVTDILVAAQTYGSAAVLSLTETFKNFGTVASDSNLTLIQAASLTEVVAGKMVDSAEAGTQLKATLINLKNAGVGYASGQFDIEDALNEVKLQVDSLGSSYEKDQKIIEIFGKRNITVGSILLNNIDKFNTLTKKLDENGIAIEKQAI